jgi:hypothetical protein
MRLVSGLALAATAAIVFLACGETQEVTQSESPAATASATPTASSAPTTAPSTPTADEVPTPPTEAYADPDYGYSFDYPVDWHVSEQPAAGSIILYSYDPANVPPEDAGKPVPPDKLKVFFSVSEGVDKPIDEWLAEQDRSPGQPAPPTVISQDEILLAGRAGVQRVTEFDGVSSVSYSVRQDGDELLLVNAGPADSEVLPEFETTVLATLKVAE